MKKKFILKTISKKLLSVSQNEVWFINNNLEDNCWNFELRTVNEDTLYAFIKDLNGKIELIIEEVK